jgi:hypothetical protein
LLSTSAKTQVVCSLINVDQALNSLHMSTAQAPVKEKPAPTAQAPVKEKPAPSVAKDETKSGAPAALSGEQHAKIWTTLRGEKAERLTNVQFSTTVGGVIPATDHLYRLPVSIVEYVPQYRDYESAMKFLSWIPAR